MLKDKYKEYVETYLNNNDPQYEINIDGNLDTMSSEPTELYYYTFYPIYNPKFNQSFIPSINNTPLTTNIQNNNTTLIIIICLISGPLCLIIILIYFKINLKKYTKKNKKICYQTQEQFGIEYSELSPESNMV
jgi:hypothetical protein